MTSLPATALILALAGLAAGCAADPQAAASNEATSTREYRTGSNIPVREPRSTTSEEKARAAAPADAHRADPAVKPTN